MSSTEKERAEITALLDRWIAAFRKKDINGVRAAWDDKYDSLVYQAEEFAGPLTNWLHIKHYYREVLTKLIASVDKWERTGLWINTSGDLGFAYSVSNFTMSVKGMDKPYSGTVRQTFVVRRVSGAWKIVHYHESLQTMPTPESFKLDEPDAP